MEKESQLECGRESEGERVREEFFFFKVCDRLCDRSCSQSATQT